MTKIYDVTIDGFREVTQEDVDRLISQAQGYDRLIASVRGLEGALHNAIIAAENEASHHGKWRDLRHVMTPGGSFK